MKTAALYEIFKNVINENLPVLEASLSAPAGGDVKSLLTVCNNIKAAAKVVSIEPVVNLCKTMDSFLATLNESGKGLGELEQNFFSAAAELMSEMAAVDAGEIPNVAAANSELIKDLSEKFAEITAAAAPPPEPPKQEAKPKLSYDPVLIDLFKIELDSHTKVLEKGLIEAEGETSNEKLEPLMRSAHSIKGAARIVGINNAVGLAHAMEDILSLAIKGEVKLTADHIDILLRGNDLFKVIAALPVDEIIPWLEENLGEVTELTDMLQRAKTGEVAGGKEGDTGAAKTGDVAGGKEGDTTVANTVESPGEKKGAVGSSGGVGGAPTDGTGGGGANDAGATSTSSTTAQTAQPQRTEKKEDALFVRVLADNLNRLLGLTGEIKIQAKFTKPFRGYLLAAKQTLREIARAESKLEIAVDSVDAALPLTGEMEALREAIEHLEWSLNIMIDKFDGFSRNIERLSESLGNRVVESKMRPIADGLHGIPRMVRELSKDSGKKIKLEITGDDTMIDRDILDKIEAPLSHLISNSVDHGIETPEERIAAGKPETGKITFEAGHRAGFLTIMVSDDGRGIDTAQIKKKVVEKGYVTADMAESLSKSELLDFLFLPGFTTKGDVTKLSGRGVGLDIVMSLIHQVGGKAKIDSEPGSGSRFTLQLPVTLSVIRALLLKVNRELYALPISRVETLFCIKPEEIHSVEDRQYLEAEGENIGIIDFARLMNLPGEGEQSEFINLAVIGDRTTKYAIAVDAFLGERDLVVTAIDAKLGKLPNISAAAILEEGSVALILDPDDLVRSIDKYVHGTKPDKVSVGEAAGGKKKTILVVDDSLTVREVERKLLENNGYEVVTAIDGVDGFNALSREQFDLVITDVDMPRMNGIQLVEKIKSDPGLKDIPVMIVSYKDREEDRLRGLNAGANYYLTKSSFHDESLVNAVIDLIGEAE